jgi:hypothetical protein
VAAAIATQLGMRDGLPNWVKDCLSPNPNLSIHIMYGACNNPFIKHLYKFSFSDIYFLLYIRIS